MSFILLQKIKNVIKFQLNRYSLINNLKKKILSLKKKSLFFLVTDQNPILVET